MRGVGKGILTLALLALAAGCLHDSEDSLPPQRPAGNVTGTVAGFSGGQVTLRPLAGRDRQPLAAADVDPQGRFGLQVRAPSQAVMLEVRGGRYTEPGSGVTVTLQEDNVLRGVALYTSGEPLELVISPLTQITAGLAEYHLTNGADPALAVEQAENTVDEAFGVDVAGVSPASLEESTAVQELNGAVLYGFYLAGLSSWTAWVSSENSAEPHTVYTTPALAGLIYTDVRADGVLDGRGDDAGGALAMGRVGLDSQVYRSAFSQHMLVAANASRNKTGVRVEDLVDPAMAMASRSTPLFVDAEPVALADGPHVTWLLEQGTYYNGEATLAAAVRSDVGVRRVSFAMDGQPLGEAADPASPVWTIDTRGYSDGPHKVSATAVDALGNERSAELELLFDNTEPFINVDAPSVVSQESVVIRGDYQDNGSGAATLTVQGNSVALSGTGQWESAVALSPGNNRITLVLTDASGNSRETEVVIFRDIDAPQVMAAGHSEARFVAGDGFEMRPLADDNVDTPLYITNDLLDLDGTPLAPKALDQAGIPYFRFRIDDADAAQGPMEVSTQYEQGETVVRPWQTLEQVDAAYLVPLVSEALSPDWHNVAADTVHVIRVRAVDAAGNETTHQFSFRAAFVPSLPTLETVDDLNQQLFRDTDFGSRDQLHDRTIETTRYVLSNDADSAVQMRIADNSRHGVDNTVEEMVRENRVRLETEEEWRLATVDGAFRLEGCPEAQPWQAVDAVLNYVGNGQWQAEQRPAPVLGDVQSVASDAPTPPEPSAWEDVPHFDDQFASQTVAVGQFELRYSYDYILERGPFVQPAYVEDWRMRAGDDRRTCPSVRLFQRRQVHTYRTEDGYPRNQQSEFVESAEFGTEGFTVVDLTNGGAIEPVSGWYRLPAGGRFAIIKRVHTPSIPIYNDTEVADPASFSSYTAKRYDKQTEWTVQRPIALELAHDLAFDSLADATLRSMAAGEGAQTYSISR